MITDLMSIKVNGIYSQNVLAEDNVWDYLLLPSPEMSTYIL